MDYEEAKMKAAREYAEGLFEPEDLVNPTSATTIDFLIKTFIDGAEWCRQNPIANEKELFLASIEFGRGAIVDPPDDPEWISVSAEGFRKGAEWYQSNYITPKSVIYNRIFVIGLFVIFVVIAAVFFSCQKPNHSTLRPQLQEMADSLLLGHEGCVVAIEPATGKVLAMSSSPYDSINHGTHWMFAPGTPIKMLIPLICLQDGVITEEQYNQSAYQCAKAFLEPDSAYENNHTIFYQRYKLMSGYLRSLGLGGQYDESDISHASGNIPSASFYDRCYGIAGWKAITIRSNFIGQGEILTTPLQLANLAAIIANEGWYISPHVFCSTSATVHRSMIDARWFQQYKKYMSEMVTCGEHYQSYVGFAPVENPKVAIAIFVNEPDTNILNVKQIAKEIYNFQ